MAAVIIRELDSFKKEFGRPRRTTLETAEEIVLEEPKTEEMPVVFLMDRFGYAHTVDESVYERNREAADSENRFVLRCLNTDRLCVFTDSGRVHLLKVLDVPYGKFRDKGTPLDNLCNYSSSEESFVAVLALNDIRDTVLTFVTRQAMVKQVQGAEFDVSKRTIAATKLQDGDALTAVHAAAEQAHLVLGTEHGFFLRFPVSEIPLKKKGAIGVRGMKLAGDDAVSGVYWLEGGQSPEAEYGGKPVRLNRLRIGSRDSKGTKARA